MTAATSGRHILLLGNGLNRLAKPLSWRSCGSGSPPPGPSPPSNRTSPFPFSSKPSSIAATAKMKQEVEASVRPMSESRLHERVRALPVHHFLTTNYDYLLENHAGAP